MATYSWSNLPPPQPMPAHQWEYKILNDFSENEINVLGRDGWRVIAVSDGRVLFEREIDLGIEATWQRVRDEQAEEKAKRERDNSRIEFNPETWKLHLVKKGDA